MNRLASMLVTGRGLVFAEAAKRLQIRPVMVEKNFWVSWTLAVLIANFATVQHLAFDEDL